MFYHFIVLRGGPGVLGQKSDTSKSRDLLSKTMLSRSALLLLCIGLLVLLVPARTSASVRVTDAAGRDLVLKSPPQRIVVVGAAPFIPLHMLYMFEEARERLKGFEAKIDKEDEFLRLIDPDYGAKVALNANPGPESVAALKPDLVIAKGTQAGDMARSLRVLGIPLMYIGAETSSMFLRDVENIGKVLGSPDRADRIVRYYRRKLSLVRNRVEDLSPEQRPDVLVMEYSDRGGTTSFKVPARSWIQTQQVELAGGNPVWVDGLEIGEGWQITGFEQIAAWDPEKIFLVVWFRLKGRKVIQGIRRDGKWRQLRAVDNNGLHLFPRDIFGWDSANPRWILGVLWMAKKTHPERFGPGDPGLKSAVLEFYRILYGMEEQAIRCHILPKMERNASA